VFVDDVRGLEDCSMSRAAANRPTDAELAILRVLWACGACTVREVHEALHPGRGTGAGYTTTLKLMQIMTAKGLVRRDEAARTHVYRAAAAREKTLRRLVGDLVERAFGGSAGQLVLHALSSRRASKEELAEIRKVLDEVEGREK
jgi:predicted transcriptional regulator